MDILNEGGGSLPTLSARHWATERLGGVFDLNRLVGETPVAWPNGPTQPALWPEYIKGDIALPNPGLSLGQRTANWISLQDPRDNGPLCRTPHAAGLPASPASIKLLRGPEFSITADELKKRMSEAKGVFPFGDDSVTITGVTPTLSPGALSIHITGFIDATPEDLAGIGTIDGTVHLVLGATTAADRVDQALKVTAPYPATTWIERLQGKVRPLAPVLNVDLYNPLEQFGFSFKDKTELDAHFQTLVADTAQSLFSSSIASDHQVDWWTSLGYLLSFHRVDVSASGIRLQPAFCKFNFKGASS